MKISERTFTPLDRHFAALMERLAGDASADLQLAARLVSFYRTLGHICLPLDKLSAETLPDGAENLPEAASWAAALRKTSVVGAPGEFTPLILDEKHRLYLRRYWEYEQRLAANLRQRLAAPRPVVDPAAMRNLLRKYFGDSRELDWQKLAAFTALTRRFSIISGGPGTGKTRTAVLILAALIEQAGGARVRIALAAPTGKAAARLKEAVKKNREACPVAVQEQLPVDASTIHRLLGSIPDSPFFQHDARNPLPFDVVVIDEASMIDLALMAKLVDAVPRESRLILLGDKDQLTSVEAGAVLGDLCHTGVALAPSRNLIRWYEQVTSRKFTVESQTPLAPIHDSLVELTRNYRFTDEGGIASFSQLINRGEADAALRHLEENQSPDLTATPLPPPALLPAALAAVVRSGYESCLQGTEPAAVLGAFDRFRVLCALRRGPFGVETLNVTIERILSDAGVIQKTGQWYHGRPVIITRNDYNLRLSNGDIGIALADPDAGGELRVFFAGAEGTLRRFLPGRLPSHETVFAMTVHKSQGSEFGRVLLILPDVETQVVTRELLYTGVTRAREKVEIWYREPVLREAILRRTERTSGLRDALWSGAAARDRIL